MSVKSKSSQILKRIRSQMDESLTGNLAWNVNFSNYDVKLLGKKKTNHCVVRKWSDFKSRSR